jgi:hypothetical protein
VAPVTVRRTRAPAQLASYRLPRALVLIRRRALRLIGGATLVLLMLVGTACGTNSSHSDDASSHHPDAGPTSHATRSTSTSPSPSTDPQAATKQKIIAAILASERDEITAVKQHDPKSPALGKHAVEPAKSQLEYHVEQYLHFGWIPAGVGDLHARVDSLNPNASPPSATVRTCEEPPKLLDLKTGKPVKSKAAGLHPATTTLIHKNGKWFVYFTKLEKDKKCSPSATLS